METLTGEDKRILYTKLNQARADAHKLKMKKVEQWIQKL